MTKELEFMHPYFMGPYAENDHIFEKILLEFVRDHAYWRRNFHPENRPPVPRTASYREDFNEFLAEMQQELHILSSDLKKSVPFFSPRYIGHMAADLLLPGVLAQMMTILYNPNNVSDDAAPATVDKEIEVGFMLAEMIGFSTDPSEDPCAWGHLTSGGSVANYESLWNFRAVKFYPISLSIAAKKFGVEVENVGPRCQKLSSYSKWELFNFSIRDTSVLMRRCLTQFRDNHGEVDFQKFTKCIVEESIEYLGMAGFFRKHKDLKPPVTLIPVTGHYSWEKATKILGIGKGQIRSIHNDGHMRMVPDHMDEILEDCFENEQPVLAVIGILGTTEFGSVDPIHRIVEAKQRHEKKNRFFGIHVDAAWGGYMTTIFRDKRKEGEKIGKFIDHETIRSKFKYFPHEGTWKAFKALSEVDSVTIDPHKLGYLPFPCGAFVSRDSGILDFIAQKAAYVFDRKEDPFKKPVKEKLKSLGQYIMEGSKPGSSAAAAYVTHRVIPLHHHGFGRVLLQSMRSCEYFFDAIRQVGEDLKETVTITIPFPPDTNLICYAINPKMNKTLGIMNHFSRKVYSHLKINPELPLPGHKFFGSFTSLLKGNLNEVEANRILGELGIDSATFVEHPHKLAESDHIYLIRHTLMNPWLMYEEDGLNYIDRYCRYLKEIIRGEFAQLVRQPRQPRKAKE